MLERLNNLQEQDSFTRRMTSKEMGFLCARKLNDGTYIGLKPLLFTIALCVGTSEDAAFERRYCYENSGDAIFEFETMPHRDHEPAGWVARRGKGA